MVKYFVATVVKNHRAGVVYSRHRKKTIARKEAIAKSKKLRYNAIVGVFEKPDSLLPYLLLETYFNGEKR